MINKKTMKQCVGCVATRTSLVLTGGVLLLALATLASCDKKDRTEYYRPTERPGQPPLENPGQIIISPPEIPATPGEPGEPPLPPPPPAPIIIVDKDDNAQEITPGQPTDVEAGTYVMTTVTTPTGPATLPPDITIIPATFTTPGAITVAPVSSGTSSGGAPIDILPPLLEILAGTGTMTVTPGGLTTGTIQLVPMTREVVLEGVLQGLDPTTLTSAVFTLEGVLNTRQIDQPFAPATKARAASLYATQTTFSIDTKGNFTTRMRLLGIDPTAAQQLVLTLTYKDTTVPPYVYSTDVTSLLAGFNTGATNQPAHLQALLSFGLDEITGTITGWTPAPPVDLPGE